MLSKKESHHALSVLRIKTGEALEIFDGNGSSRRGIASKVVEGRLSVQMNKNDRGAKSAPSSAAEITLAVSVIKPERMDLLIQKSCELGVRRIVPLLTERSVVRLPKERWEAKTERWKKIVLESCKQCGRSAPPEVDRPLKFDEFYPQSKNWGRVLIPTLALPGKDFYETCEGLSGEKTLVFIGPEGDFTKNEAQKAVSCGALPVSLGPLVMRTETAAIYVLSVLSFLSNRC